MDFYSILMLKLSRVKGVRNVAVAKVTKHLSATWSKHKSKCDAENIRKIAKYAFADGMANDVNSGPK